MVTRPRILVVDDEVRLAEALRQGLERHGYDVSVAHEGNAAITKARAGGFDLILLDVMIPELSGYRVLESMRREGIDTPVMMLTAKDGEYDEADAFDLGADDYVTKPFSTVVLLARIASILRRRPEAAPVVNVGNLKLEPRRHRCWVGEQEISLTAREYAVLAYLCIRVDEPVSKHELLEQIWEDPEMDPNVVEVCVMQLRRKVGAEWIQTIRNVGYRFVDPGPAGA